MGLYTEDVESHRRFRAVEETDLTQVLSVWMQNGKLTGVRLLHLSR